MAGEHVNHRQRMRERVRRGGLEQLAPHEALEYLLYHSIPQGDVNPLAHRLLNRFGTLEAVLCAPEDELTQVSGVGTHTVEFLHAVSELSQAYFEARQRERKPIGKLRDAVGDYISGEELPASPLLETFFFDKEGYLLHREKLPWDEPFLKTRTLAAAAIDHRAYSAVLLLTCGREGYAMSEQTWAELKLLIRSFVSLEIRVVDVLTRSPDEVISCREKGLLTEEMTSPVAYSAAEADDWAQDADGLWGEWNDEDGFN